MLCHSCCLISVAVYDSRVGAVIRRCIKPSHVIHLALHKQVFLYIEPSSLHITIDLVSTKYFNNKRASCALCKMRGLQQDDFTAYLSSCYKRH